MELSGWDVANRVGIIFTIVGTVFTIVTWWMVGGLKTQLVKKYRVPAVLIKLETDLLPALRTSLAAPVWSEESRRASTDVVSTIRGYVQNIRPSLTEKEMPCAKKLISLMRVRRWALFRVKFDQQRFWEIHDELRTFVALIDGLDKDNEARRL